MSNHINMINIKKTRVGSSPFEKNDGLLKGINYKCTFVIKNHGKSYGYSTSIIKKPSMTQGFTLMKMD